METKCRRALPGETGVMRRAGARPPVVVLGIIGQVAGLIKGAIEEVGLSI